MKTISTLFLFVTLLFNVFNAYAIDSAQQDFINRKAFEIMSLSNQDLTEEEIGARLQEVLIRAGIDVVALEERAPLCANLTCQCLDTTHFINYAGKCAVDNAGPVPFCGCYCNSGGVVSRECSTAGPK